MNSHEVFKQIAATGARIFCIRLSTDHGREDHFWVHPNKTMPEWRADLRELLGKKFDDEKGWANNGVLNAMYLRLSNMGYHEIVDVVADVYEGRISNDSACLVDDPDHENQADGFGHFGWENK